MRVVIVGGGTAGWMAAGWLVKKNPGVKITLIESPDIPIIGVGESVTPHVASFFKEMGVPAKDWMQKTGSIYKFANKFVGWKDGNNEYEYFSFNYTSDANVYYKDVSHAVSYDDWLLTNDTQNKTTDLLLDLYNAGVIDKFDKYFNSQFHYMEKNVAPFQDNNYLLNPTYSWSQHINAELASIYVRDYIAKPAGVTHIQQKITKVNVAEDSVKSVLLENGETITGDLFVDASGGAKVLVRALGWKEKIYQDNPVNRAWVCQLDYDDQETEMVNYTQSIAKKHGWLFKIGLYHRMGTGYCFSSSHVSDDDALIEYKQMVKNLRREPRLIKWTPSRLTKMADKNVVAVGLSSGFVEPMEANALFITINCIGQLSRAIEHKMTTGEWDFASLNEKLTYSIDDIADFIKVHYTLSNRTDSDFWNDMKLIHQRDNHVDLIYSKYVHPNNIMTNAVAGYSLFPDYMWAQLATSWGIDTKSWYRKPDQLTTELAKMHLLHQEKKHRLIADTRQNNYNWLKEHIFDQTTSAEWEKHLIR
jgi:tryptophan halogenase